MDRVFASSRTPVVVIAFLNDDDDDDDEPSSKSRELVTETKGVPIIERDRSSSRERYISPANPL